MLFAASTLLLALGVMSGAFGAHVLKDKLTPGDLEIYNKAVLYQLVHALGIGMTALIALTQGDLAQAATRAGNLLLLGIVIFSGSLYLLVLTDTRWLGAITPIGGTIMIASWIYLSWVIIKS